jgi:hypothetical protein
MIATESYTATPQDPQGCMARLVRDFDFERGEEYNDLLRLINLAGSMNKGSGIVDKIKEIEAIVDKLTRSDMIKPRQSFMQWLGEVAFNFHSANTKEHSTPKES